MSAKSTTTLLLCLIVGLGSGVWLDRKMLRRDSSASPPAAASNPASNRVGKSVPFSKSRGTPNSAITTNGAARTVTLADLEDAIQKALGKPNTTRNQSLFEIANKIAEAEVPQAAAIVLKHSS